MSNYGGLSRSDFGSVASARFGTGTGSDFGGVAGDFGNIVRSGAVEDLPADLLATEIWSHANLRSDFFIGVGATVVSGSSVDSIASPTDPLQLFEGATTRRPTLITDDRIRFDGGDDRMDGNAATVASVGVADDDFTAIVLCTMDDSAGQNVVWFIRGSEGSFGDFFDMECVDNTSVGGLSNREASGNKSVSLANSGTAWMLLVVESKRNAAMRIRINNGSWTSGTVQADIPRTTAVLQVTLGNVQVQALPYAGDMALGVMVGTAFSDADHTAFYNAAKAYAASIGISI